jgi:death-on-curing protein
VQPVFLTLAEVLEIQRNQIGLYGGRMGVRDLGLLQSALAAPQAGIRSGYLHTDLIEMASAYLYHIVRNHPFVDGNKRTGALAAIVFLALNDIRIDTPEAAFESLVLAVGGGSTDRASVAAFLKKHVVR